VIEFQSTGGALQGNGLTRLEFGPAGKTTRLTVSSDLRGLLGLLANLVGSAREPDGERLTNLKALLEARIPPPLEAPEELTVAEPEPAASEVQEAISETPAPAPMATNGSVAEDRPAAPARAGGQLILQLESESGPAATFEVARSGATLGRGEENSIRLNDLSVSRRHARISYRQGGYWISDLGSTSGTWVDGTRLNAAGRLTVGQKIDVGVCRLTVALAADAPTRETVAGATRRSAVSGRRRR
jgi:hypothetical protein